MVAEIRETALIEMTEAELIEAERVIERGQQTFVEVGKALMEIRAGKGYRLKGYSTFEDYCQRRWGWSRQYGHQLMAAVEAAENVNLGLQNPPTYKQALELSRLKPEEQRGIVSQVDLSTVTTRQLREIVNETKDVGGNNTYASNAPDRYGYHDAFQVIHHEPEKKLPAHVSYNSGNNEWYTPESYIRAAWQVMDGIDLDPASSDIANKTVGARSYYTTEENGLLHDWRGNVWMNPPYAGELIGQFSEKLVNHFKQGDITQAIVLVNNATETNWFQGMLIHASAICFPKQRVRFIDEEGNPTGAPLQGQAVLYFGQNAARFAESFADFGIVLYGPTGRN